MKGTFRRWVPRSCLMCAGIASGRVMSANFSAEPQSQERVRRQLGDRLGNRPLRSLGVLQQCLHDHVDRHRVMVGVPAVVVGHQGERDVAHFRFAGELGLLQVRHPDDVHAPRSVEPRLGQRRKLRAFHADIRAASMDVCADRLHGVGGDASELRTNRMGERHVRREAAAEKRADARLCAIEKLVGDDDIERRVFGLEAADRAGRDDALRSQQLESKDVCPEVELRWKQTVTRAVPRQKRDPLSAERAEEIRTRRIAERRCSASVPRGPSARPCRTGRCRRSHQFGPSLRHLLDVPLAVFPLANVASRDIGIVLEDDEIFALHGFAQEGLA